jgi:phage host-nuclease inhibitor protein Gam
MKNKRIKSPITDLLESRDAAERVMSDLTSNVNRQRYVVSRRDKAVLEITKPYDEDLAGLATRIAAQTESLRAWAEANPAEFGKRKSIEMIDGTIGFRTGTPALKLLSRAWNWAKALAAVERTLPNFIRSKPEIDKEAIISQREELKEFLPSCGLKVDQGETFFVEPKLSEIETVQKSEVQKAA